MSAPAATPAAILDPASIQPETAFGRLFENEFITLECVGISRRTAEGMEYLDESDALQRLLGEVGTSARTAAGDPAIEALHAAMYAAWPDVEAVVCGRPLHLRAMLAEELPLPAATSPMINRGVPDLAVHLVQAAALFGPDQPAVLAAARARAETSGMRHVLLVTSDALVCAAGPTLHEVMAHYSNVAFAALADCLRIEEQLAHRA